MIFDEIIALSSCPQRGNRKKINKKKSVKTVDSTSLDKIILKTKKKALCTNIQEGMKLRKKPYKKGINNDSVCLFRKTVRIQQKRGSKYIGIEDDRQSEATSNRSLDQEHTDSESFVETLKTKVAADEVTETKKQNVDEDMDSDLSEELDESSVSQVSYCCGNIFCDCNSCKNITKSLLQNKLKPDGKYFCGLCKKRFLQKSHLMEHKKGKCDSSKPFSCAFCAKVFDTKSYIKLHMDKFHSASVSEKSLKFKCVLCNKYFCSNESLTNHKTNQHFLMDLKRSNYSCALCPKAYKYKSDLRHHETQSHGDEKFECGHCSDVFKSKRYLNVHMRRTHLATIQKCGECPKIFSSAMGLKKHFLSVHSDSKVERGFICETCGKFISTKLTLQKHILTHTGEKPHICQVCGKNFRTESNLYQHSRTHSDKRPFSCDLCSKTFRIKHHLRQHMAVHGMAHTSVRRKKISTSN